MALPVQQFQILNPGQQGGLGGLSAAIDKYRMMQAQDLQMKQQQMQNQQLQKQISYMDPNQAASLRHAQLANQDASMQNQMTQQRMPYVTPEAIASLAHDQGVSRGIQLANNAQAFRNKFPGFGDQGAVGATAYEQYLMSLPQSQPQASGQNSQLQNMASAATPAQGLPMGAPFRPGFNPAQMQQSRTQNQPAYASINPSTQMQQPQSSQAMLGVDGKPLPAGISSFLNDDQAPSLGNLDPNSSLLDQFKQRNQFEQNMKNANSLYKMTMAKSKIQSLLSPSVRAQEIGYAGALNTTPAQLMKALYNGATIPQLAAAAGKTMAQLQQQYQQPPTEATNTKSQAITRSNAISNYFNPFNDAALSKYGAWYGNFNTNAFKNYFTSANDNDQANLWAGFLTSNESMMNQIIKSTGRFTQSGLKEILHTSGLDKKLPSFMMTPNVLRMGMSKFNALTQEAAKDGNNSVDGNMPKSAVPSSYFLHADPDNDVPMYSKDGNAYPIDKRLTDKAQLRNLRLSPW